MKYCIFSDNEWIYPDSECNDEQVARLFAARNADVCFQILTDHHSDGEEAFSASLQGVPAEATVYQLLPATVEENSSPTEHTTMDYESVKHFVTRRAPFEVYDITRPIENGRLCAERVALYVRLDVKEDAQIGEFDGTLLITVGEEQIRVPISLKIYSTVMPKLSDAAFHMVNWIYYEELAKHHGVEMWSEGYHDCLVAYLENQLDMRNDYLMLPSGEPICDADGRVIDFDFSHAEYVGNLALSMGFRSIMGGFVARWKHWADSEIYLLWDRDVDVTSIEGFRHLKLYFTRAWECVCKNNWQSVYYQCAVDEPQFSNSAAYRALICICRQQMPGVRVHDPVESTDIAGGPDVWVIKQKTYEQYLKTFTALQEMGEEMWIYTCGYPASSTMNRVMDLPLSVSRLPMWMCYRYGAKGFLHWGYHVHTPAYEKETCFPCANGKRMPSGNGFVVYPGERKPWYGVRGHSQRSGAFDYELLSMLGARDEAAAMRLIERVCRTFDDYDPSAKSLDGVRRELLDALERA